MLLLGLRNTKCLIFRPMGYFVMYKNRIVLNILRLNPNADNFPNFMGTILCKIICGKICIHYAKLPTNVAFTRSLHATCRREKMKM